MPRDPDHDLCRHPLARQVLEACERRCLRLWQQAVPCMSPELSRGGWYVRRSLGNG